MSIFHTPNASIALLSGHPRLYMYLHTPKHTLTRLHTPSRTHIYAHAYPPANTYTHKHSRLHTPTVQHTRTHAFTQARTILWLVQLYTIQRSFVSTHLWSRTPPVRQNYTLSLNWSSTIIPTTPQYTACAWMDWNSQMERNNGQFPAAKMEAGMLRILRANVRTVSDPLWWVHWLLIAKSH